MPKYSCNLKVRWKVLSEWGCFSATVIVVANHLKVVKDGAGVLVDIVAAHLAHGDGGESQFGGRVREALDCDL